MSQVKIFLVPTATQNTNTRITACPKLSMPTSLSLSSSNPKKKKTQKSENPSLSLSLEAFRDRWQCSGFWCVTAWSHSWFWFHFSAGSGLSFRGLSSNAFTSFLPSAPTITSCTPFLSHNRFCSIAIPP